MTMIEKVARAICKDMYTHASDKLLDSAWPSYADAAKAAIEAMSEPSDVMLKAFHTSMNIWIQENGADEDVFGAMIDAALKDAP